MSDIKTQIVKLEEKAMALKEQVDFIIKFRILNKIQKKYLDALKKYDELILLKKEVYGDKSDTVIYN